MIYFIIVIVGEGWGSIEIGFRHCYRRRILINRRRSTVVRGQPEGRHEPDGGSDKIDVAATERELSTG